MSGLYSTHVSLDALLAVIDSIEQHCHHRLLSTATISRVKSDSPSEAMVTTAANEKQASDHGQGCEIYNFELFILL